MAVAVANDESAKHGAQAKKDETVLVFRVVWVIDEQRVVV
jgi:hypothetical protein